MTKKKPIHLIILLLLPAVVFGQEINYDLQDQMQQIDEYVELIDSTEDLYSEGIAEGPFLEDGNSESEAIGGWTAYYLYKDQDENSPLRVRLNMALLKTYEQYDFYYQNQNLIFVKLKVSHNESQKKDENFERVFYFMDGKLISKNESDLSNYSSDSILRTDEFVRRMIYQ